MKVFILTTTLICLCTSQIVFADVPADDPLAESRETPIRLGGDELIGIRTKLKSGNDYNLAIEVSRYFDTIHQLKRVLEYSVPDVIVDRNFNRFGITTLDANGNGLSEIAAAWTIDNRVHIVALTADPNNLGFEPIGAAPQTLDDGQGNDNQPKWEDTTRVAKTSPAPFSGDSWLRTPPLLTSGDFNGNGKEELILAYMYIASNHPDVVINLNLSLFEVSNTIQEWAYSRVQQIKIDQPAALRPAGRPVTIFDMTAGDFNGDGKDEILLVGRESDGDGNWNLFASIYSLAGPNSLVRILHEVIYTMPDSDPNIQFEIQNISVAKGNFFSGEAEQAVVGFTQYNTHDIYASYMIGLSFDNELEGITISEEPFRRLRASQTGQGAYWDNVVRTGDITGNGLHEIVSNAGHRHSKNFRIYRLDDELRFVEYANNLNIPQHNTSPVFVLGDVMRTGEDAVAELVTAKQSLYKFNIHPDGSYQGVTLALDADFDTYGCWFPGGNYQYECSSTLVSAELDGDIRIGIPRRYRITNITQPLVILKAPPTHFDIFDGKVYDLSNSYNPHMSNDFSVVYTIDESEEDAIQTEFTRDWGVSGELSFGGSFLGTGVNAHLKTNYGQQFSKKETKKRTVAVSTRVALYRDDRIYATTMSYDIWEYPVINDGVERGYILVVDPEVIQDRWISGRDPEALTYIADHEVGNILSYRSSPPGPGEIGGNDLFTGDIFSIGEDSDYIWTLDIQEFTANETSTEKKFNLDVGASASKWGVKLAIGGSYGTEDISTQKTTVTEALSVEVKLGTLTSDLGDIGSVISSVNYSVQPLVYWTKDGALVVDYIVDPSIQVDPPTFWSYLYGGKPDPGFILPWRYWKEKGGRQSDHPARYQTKDITFYPQNPERGDIVTITASVRNFSLVEKSERVGVSFYLGDPDNGGTLITGLENTTTAYTSGGIPARGTRTVEMQWAVPDNVIGTRPRIYGVIQPTLVPVQVPQIHDNNTKGWAVLGRETFGTGIDDDLDYEIPATFVLHQNYPNPFNPGTTFEFTIPSAGTVTLEVYNILGQKVATVISAELAGGSYSHYWDAQGLASGVYVYRLQAGGFVESRKLLLLK